MTMMKLFSVVVALAFALSVAVAASAGSTAGPVKTVLRAQATVSGGSGGPENQAKPARKTTARKASKRRQVTGTVVAVDEAAGTLTVKGRRGPVTLKAGDKVKLEGIKIGDRVLSMYSGGTAFRVKKVSERKTAGGRR